MAAHENVPVFAPDEHDEYDLNMMRKKLRHLGLFLVFTGASIVLKETHQCSASYSKNISLGYAIFVEGIILLWLSLVVHLFPRTAALVNAVLNHATYFFEG